MKDFYRSIKYVLPYKGRLVASVFCVVMISLLWAGGLGAIVPGAKILISEEGLHGWSDQKMTQSRLKASTVRHKITADQGQAAWGTLTEVMLVTGVEAAGPAATAGIKPLDWIVGIRDEGRATPLSFEDLHKELAKCDIKAGWSLLVADSAGGAKEPRTAVVSPAEARWDARALRWIVAKVPRPAQRQDRYFMLVWVLALGLGMTILRDMFRFAQGYLVQTTVYRAIMDLRCECYEVALRLPLGHFAANGTSDIINRFVVASNQVAAGLIALFGQTLVEPGKMLGAFAVALYLNWKLTLLACAAGPLTYLLIRQLGKQMRRATKKTLKSQARMLGSLVETLDGIRVVKACTAEQFEQKRFRAINRQLYKELKPKVAVDSATGPSVETLGVLAAMAAAAVAGYWVFQGQLDRDVFLALMATLAAMYDPARRLSQVVTRFHAADAAAQQLFQLHDDLTETDRPGATELPRHAKSIELCNVGFTYANAARPALRDVNLRIEHGQSVAIVGANGSGKTTLVSMLPRLFCPDAGAVLVDGIDLANVTLASLRQQIALVPQEPVIFHATVAENIAYGAQHATDEQIKAAAKQAFVDEFARQMPQGYDTIVGERGTTLSGGQRQRIAIARAILRDPTILIFDEAMSQIDSESEAKIHQAIEKFMAGRTTLLIAHRFNTVLSADRLVVMNDGQIIDVGGHAELLGRCAVYRALFETQLIAGESRS
ncbi:MAG: ATP-binding cassette domain-containing protein [Planctomycetes bacterium]|nr:ATP-binding cassette domain-containing protein [Planctomycetota bacterium]